MIYKERVSHTKSIIKYTDLQVTILFKCSLLDVYDLISHEILLSLFSIYQDERTVWYNTSIH